MKNVHIQWESWDQVFPKLSFLRLLVGGESGAGGSKRWRKEANRILAQLKVSLERAGRTLSVLGALH